MSHITHYATVEYYNAGIGTARPIKTSDVIFQAQTRVRMEGGSYDQVAVDMLKGLWFKDYPGKGRQSIVKVATA